LNLPDAVWYVAVIGNEPSEKIDALIKNVLSGGTVIALPDATIAQLLQKREAQTQRGSWVEGH
jgi:hypothetical protein